MSAQSEFIAALERGDVREVRRISEALHPHLPRAESDAAAEISMHMARTQVDALPLQTRVYSHRWLTERSLPSQLPDELKPSAERLFPTVAEAVFVSANVFNPEFKPAAAIVQRAMCDAVEDAYANGDREPSLVRRLMGEARRKTWKQLIGVE